MSVRLFIVAVAAVGSLSAAMPAGAEPRSLDLSLDNAGERTLRCSMVIAHFMSDELGEIAPGERLMIALEGDNADGSLFVRSGDGRRKPIENILCGASDDWAQTRGEVPLLPLRTSSSERAHMACHLEGRLRCIEMAP
ncbi:hypothetical protein HBA54_14145 [Pelagibius litoralis]|uniref:Uncharacterized protein n=1 Tax=Pelagibius litoralis TaxID=374515 RepID=A0A967EYM7_9PROT|nr:hypothetical protein [Pelagibius litoralis]NIA69740.1 hypothetical protein [Pelagibius litoralis]